MLDASVRVGVLGWPLARIAVIVITASVVVTPPVTIIARRSRPAVWVNRRPG